MSQIYGVMSPSAIEDIASIVAAASVPPGVRTDALPGTAWAGWCPFGRVSVARSDRSVASVLGRPVFHDAMLAGISRAKGPAAALLAAYERSGADCTQVTGGSFAFAVIDGVANKLVLAVDRAGTFGLCFARLAGGIAFGSRAEAVAAHPDLGRRLNPQGIYDYLNCKMVPAPASVFAGVEKLRPAERLVWQDGKVERSFYWRLHYDDDGAADFASLKTRFRRILEASVRDAAGDDDPGCFLSGGTDSSTVAGTLRRLRGKADTYSIGFAVSEFDEIEYARIAARHFGLNAHEYFLKPDDVVEAIPVIARAYDEPFGNDSAVPTWLCARFARESGKTVVLAGDGGDEIFGGNARYVTQRVFEWYGRVPAALRRGLVEPVAFGIPGGQALAPVRKLRSYIRQAKLPLPERLETYNFFKRMPVEEILTPEFLASIDPGQPDRLRRETYFRADSAHYVNRMMHLDLEFTLADNDLRKVGRMCEVAGIEVRYPLLADEMVEFSGTVPVSLKIRGTRLRHFFKEALADFLPSEIINKKKHGFGLPFGEWSVSHPALCDLVDGRLDALSRRGIVRPDYIADLRRRQKVEHATYYGFMVWVLVILEEWLSARGL